MTPCFQRRSIQPFFKEALYAAVDDFRGGARIGDDGRIGAFAQAPGGSDDKMDKDKMMDKKQ